MMFTLNDNVVSRPIQAFKEELSETMIKKYNDYKCSAPYRRRQCHCCCYPAYQSCWLIIPLQWHQFYGLWNASQCFHNAIQLGYSIYHWAEESLLIGWRADCHSPAEEGHGFWRSGYEVSLCRRLHINTKLHTFVYIIGINCSIVLEDMKILHHYEMKHLLL